MRSDTIQGWLCGSASLAPIIRVCLTRLLILLLACPHFWSVRLAGDWMGLYGRTLGKSNRGLWTSLEESVWIWLVPAWMRVLVVVVADTMK